MNKTKTILTYLVIIFFFGCASKKSVSEKVYIKETDSINRTLQLKTQNKLIITSLCDSITGKAKDYSNSQNNGLNTVKTSIKDNTLTIETKSDSIVYVDRFKDKIVYVDKEVEKVKYKTPKWVWIPIIIILIFVIFPIVPKVIHGLIRNFF